MAGEVIKVGDGVMNRDEALKMAGGFEPLHDPLSSPGWLMLILGAIVEPLVLTMLEFHADVLAYRAIGSEPVRDQNTRNTSLFADELAQESLGGAPVTTALHQRVKHEAVLIDGAPEPVFLAADGGDESSSPGELHPQALTDPDVSVSTHPAPTVHPVNGFALPKGSSRMAVDLSIKPASVAASL